MSTPTIARPAPVAIHVPINIIDDFFGATGTRASRHDHDFSQRPPSYSAGEPAPAYEEVNSAEPITLAMYLFKFGFLFPPFWLLGIFILFSPLRSPPSSPSSTWMPDKSEDEKLELIEQIRKTEVKWARRCAYTAAIFTLLATTCGVVIWAVVRD